MTFLKLIIDMGGENTEQVVLTLAIFRMVLVALVNYVIQYGDVVLVSIQYHCHPEKTISIDNNSLK